MGPETRYTKSGDVHLAYQVVGDGPRDLLFVPGWVSHLEYGWEEPSYARFLHRLASFSRLILFDKRGTGLSDRVPEARLPTLEQRMDDVRAVLDAAGSERAALFGFSEGAPMCALYAATYPERTAALVLVSAYAKRPRAPDYPWGPSAEEVAAMVTALPDAWGGPVTLDRLGPSALGDARFVHWWATFLRRSASPGAAAALLRMNMDVDIRPALPAIQAPTLVLHRTGDLVASIEEGRYLAARIPGARLVELPGIDHCAYVGDADAVLDEVEEFLTGARPAGQPDRVLATVLYTDIVGSTEAAASLGDRRWRDLLEQHNRAARRELERHRGREVKATGDGFLAAFDGPARAIRCALAIREGVRPLGLDIRAGLHTGECEVLGDDLGGIAVHIGARVGAMAGPGEVLVSGTVKDLVAGSGIAFAGRGAHTLKGIPGQWNLFAVQ